MKTKSKNYKPYYCYIDQSSGNSVVTLEKPKSRQQILYFYVAACPTEAIAKRVYERYLDIRAIAV